MTACMICGTVVSSKDCCTWDICKTCHGGMEDVERCNRENALTEEQRKAMR